MSLRWNDSEVERVNICDLHGRIVQQHAPVPGANNLDVRIESQGIYWVYLIGQGRSRAEKVVSTCSKINVVIFFHSKQVAKPL
ncbi:MAG: hypothetical protein ACKVUS_07065 [Saprospiraceae bacterium]